jgi:hypothetical protein
METSYEWRDALPEEQPASASSNSAATHMTLRNRGEPRGFSTWLAPLMSAAMRRATTADLERLKTLLKDDAER